MNLVIRRPPFLCTVVLKYKLKRNDEGKTNVMSRMPVGSYLSTRLPRWEPHLLPIVLKPWMIHFILIALANRSRHWHPNDLFSWRAATAQPAIA
jgi:hypothetical protein